jgi:tetratricopeptide (TPR) repeat protein
LVHLSSAQQVDGADLSGYLTGAGREKSSRPLFSESRWPEYYGCCSLFGVVEGTWKYIRAPKPELYDLRRDPGEQNNLVDKEPQRVRRLRDRVDRWRQAMASAAKPRTAGGTALPKGMIEQLESLGYVGGGDGSSDAEAGADLKLEDPKDFLAVFEHCQAGTELAKRHRYQEARKEFEQMVLERPQSVLGHLSLGEVAMWQSHEAEAVREVSTALTLLTQSKAAPTSWTALIQRRLTVRCHLRLGRAFDLDGKPDDAIREYQTTFQLFPEAVDLPEYSDFINLLAARGRFPEAIAHCRRAPGDPMLRNKLAWMLATLPDASVRDGAEAVAIARQLVQSRRVPDPLLLTTLAAAYAETGQFPQAVATAERALALAKSARQTNFAVELKSELQSQLDLYRAGRPCRVTPKLPERRGEAGEGRGG